MRRRSAASLALPFSFALTACSSPAQNARPELEPPMPPLAVSSLAPKPLPRTAFENPGGMWLPSQLGEHADTLKAIGFELDPASLTTPTSPLLGAIVWLGGCSASFVSPDGLVITNHHCVTGALQYNATKDANALVDGLHAKSRADERWAGPTARVYVTQAFRDVTGDVRRGLDTIADDLARAKAIESRSKELVAACEANRPGLRCSVARSFGGAAYTLYEQLELRDVRLVYAPPEGVGNYGGEIDNWRWPRHTGDFAFYRAYVGPDGKPADHAPANVPYKPPHWLRLAKEPLRPGAPVLVAGYPGMTERLTTAAEASDAVAWDLPGTIDFCETYLKELERVAATDKELAIKAETFIRGLGNWLTNTKGQLEGLTKGGLAEEKRRVEAELAAWIEQDPGRKARFGGAIEAVNKAFAESRREREQVASLRELLRMVRGFSAAHAIVRNAEERAKPDAERDPDFQERNQKRLEQQSIALEKTFAPALDRALLRLVVARELAKPAAARAGIAEAVLGRTLQAGEVPSAKAIDGAIDALYAKTKLGTTSARLALLTKATPKELAKSGDPLVRLALALRPKTRAFEERGKRLAGAMSLVRPALVEAMRERAAGRLAPDANSTLRITYGTVRGYAPTKGAPVYAPFTRLDEVVKKHTGSDPFVAPKALLDAAAAGRKGPYVDEALGDVPVDFLSDLDITGGNSGSATLDARGDLVGLAFDGNYESMASDWLFMPEVTRSIHVDVRYVLWVLDAVAGADALLRELGVTPAFAAK